uniref:Uncharacterized protein n=1 Tax=Oryza nivara TaxID=4536 RepID=A0A0E0GEW4_ORYNI
MSTDAGPWAVNSPDAMRAASSAWRRRRRSSRTGSEPEPSPPPPFPLPPEAAQRRSRRRRAEAAAAAAEGGRRSEWSGARKSMVEVEDEVVVDVGPAPPFVELPFPRARDSRPANQTDKTTKPSYRDATGSFNPLGCMKLIHQALDKVSWTERMHHPYPCTAWESDLDIWVLLDEIHPLIVLLCGTPCIVNAEYGCSNNARLLSGIDGGLGRALDEVVPHIPLADILDLVPKLLHLLGHTVPLEQRTRKSPPGWPLKMNSEILEAVLNIIGSVTDLLHPSLDHLAVILLLVRLHHERPHHLKLICNKCVGPRTKRTNQLPRIRFPSSSASSLDMFPSSPSASSLDMSSGTGHPIDLQVHGGACLGGGDRVWGLERTGEEEMCGHCEFGAVMVFNEMRERGVGDDGRGAEGTAISPPPPPGMKATITYKNKVTSNVHPMQSFNPLGCMKLIHQALDKVPWIERMNHPYPCTAKESDLNIWVLIHSLIILLCGTPCIVNAKYGCSNNARLLSGGDGGLGAEALDEVVPHIPLADILDLVPELLHLLGHMAPLEQCARESPPGWPLQMNSKILEAVLNIIGSGMT